MRPSTSRRSHRFLTLLVALAVLASACTSGEDDSSSDTVQPIDSTETVDGSDTTESTEETAPQPSVEPLEWSACEPLECTTIMVPRDYSEPDGPMLEIAVARQPATDQANRIGSLVLNPGGPGGSGIDYLRSAVFTIPQEVQARFDLVSFDPRGVGASSAVDCDINYDDLAGLVPEGDDAAWAMIVEEDQALIASCPGSALELAPYVGTNNAARDLDQLRAAVGDEKLTYLGYSYGTRLGATYAELFPDNVRALVLDGGVLPTDDLTAIDLEQAKGFDLAFENFAAQCDADADCLLQEIGPTIEVFRTIEAEIRDVGSFQTDDPERVLTPAEFYIGVIAALYSVSAWPFLAQALYTAETGADGTLLQVLGDNLVGRKVDGSYDNSNEANGFINCADDPRRPDVAETRADVYESAAQTVYFGDAFRASTGCLTAPPAIDSLTLGPATGSQPILVIGNTGDPATPYEWSAALADSLESGVLYSVEAEGHTAYGSFECVAPVVNAYLIDLEVPAEGGSCSANADADFFPPAGESDFDLVISFIDCIRDEGIDVAPVGTADLLADPTLEKLLEDIDIENPDTIAAVLACQSLLPTP